MKKLLLIPALAITLVGCSNTIQKSKDPISTSEKPKIANEKPLESSSKTISKTTIDEKKIADPRYVTYTDDLYESLLGKKPFVLFFHAGWCPTCRQMEEDITANLDSFPDGTTILKADFDTETDLEQKYGIVAQSSIVVLNAKGETVSKLLGPDSNTLKDAVEKSL